MFQQSLPTSPLTVTFSTVTLNNQEGKDRSEIVVDSSLMLSPAKVGEETSSELKGKESANEKDNTSSMSGEFTELNVSTIFTYFPSYSYFFYCCCNIPVMEI